MVRQRIKSRATAGAADVSRLRSYRCTIIASTTSNELVRGRAVARLELDVGHKSNRISSTHSGSYLSSAVLFVQMMFLADQVYRTRLRSFSTELFCEPHF